LNNAEIAYWVVVIANHTTTIIANHTTTILLD
jgi:hypothetical protein